MTTFYQVQRAQKSINSAIEQASEILEGNKFQFDAEKFDNEFVYFQIAGEKFSESQIRDLKEKTRFALIEEQYLGKYYIATYYQYI